ncbi:ribonuclease H-like domain-containing protein [Mycena metata]|uniref:Ribonuclease H-like domain-containing protein n=1 Tax=Mycena metata TaxID=1033252 RepID=A0AAD7INB3_9AGAR|nr:ribonuclease H-like domain-containing protein [Mycena metata]
MEKLWPHFHRGVKQNDSQYITYCKACVAHELAATGATASNLTKDSQAFKDGSQHGEKSVMIAHLIGGRVECPHASNAAKAVATTVCKETKDTKSTKDPESKKHTRTDSTGSPDVSQPLKKKHTIYAFFSGLPDDEKAALEKQALRAIVSSGAAFQFFEDPEVKILFGMLHTTAPDILPSAKVVGGRLLDAAAVNVEAKTTKALKDKKIGLSTDGWKSLKKDAINALCANTDFQLFTHQSYLLELIDVTDLKKDGVSQGELFAEMIDRVELAHGCIVIYLTTDADGGSKKGQINLGKKRPWLILPSCWAHQFQLILGDYFKVNDVAALIAEDATALIGWINNHGRVRKIFNESQGIISLDRVGKIIILAYLVANLTCWTTHYVTFMQLFLLRQALVLAVMQKRQAIIAAQVGAAVSTEATRLREEAEKFCLLIEDVSFWSGLETVLGDLEPICLGTNINQKDSTRLDQVLLTIAGIFLHFVDHPEEEVRTSMLIRLEKCWKDCDQPVFLLALILNPFEKLSCFGPATNLNQLKCRNLLVLSRIYLCINSWPDNLDSPEKKAEKEKALSKAFMQYLAGNGDFVDFNAKEWENTYDNTDPIMVCEVLVDSTHLAELANFAITILHIVANQAGCERTFSRTKIEQADRRNNLGLGKIGKRTKTKMPRIRMSTVTPSYPVQMAKWISDVKLAEREELANELKDAAAPEVPDAANTPRLLTIPTWKPMTLAVLFGGAEKPRARKPSARVMEEEELLMEILADAAEEARPDDGSIEIDSGDEFQP